MTAVEWLIEQYNNCPRYEENLTDGDFSKALEMEKEQAERMYSEEEVLNILVEHTVELFKGQPCTLTEFFEQFKKK